MNLAIFVLVAAIPTTNVFGQQLVEDITKLANPEHRTIEQKPTPKNLAPERTPSGMTVYTEPKPQSRNTKAPEARPPAPKHEPAQPDGGSLSSEFDIEKHCKHIGSLPTGGSYTLEQTCRNQEREALRKLQGQSIPPEIEKHCAHLGSLSTGGSYSLMLTCVQQEITAKNNLR